MPLFNPGPTTNPVSIAQGGTGQITAAAAFNALSPLVTLGDTLYASVAGVDTALPGNTTATKRFMTQTGTGTVSAAPIWALIVAADVPNIAESQVTNLTADLAARALLASTNVFTAIQEINLNAAALPSPQTGALLQLGNADGTPSRLEVDAFGSTAFFSAVGYGGTAAAPTAITANTQIGGINAWGYNGTTVVGPVSSLRQFAAENFSSGHQGSYLDLATTPIGSTTLTGVVRIENDGGVTIPSTVTGGSKGVGSLNAAGLYVNGVAASTYSSPLTTLGDIIYGGAAGAQTRLGGNTTATKQFLTQTGTGTVSAAPAWAAIASADLTTALTTPPPIGGTTQNTGVFTTVQGLTAGNTGVWAGTWVGGSTLGALYYTGVAQTGSNYALVMGASSTSLNHASATTIATAGVARLSFSTVLATFSVATTIAGGIVNLNSSSNFATNINIGTNTQNTTIGGASNTTVIASAGLTLSALTTTSSASVGGATALPALPQGYVTITIGGTAQKLAYFNV